MDEPISASPTLHGWNQPQGFGGAGFGGQGYGGQGYGGQGFGQGFGQDFGGQMFPGLGDPFAGPPAFVNPTVLPPAQGAAGGKGGFSFAELKGMIDRMGGIDGVMNGVTKAQKFVGIMSQMAPLLRIFLGKGAKAVATATSTGRSPRRRQGRSGSVRRRTAGKGRRPYASGSRRR